MKNEELVLRNKKNSLLLELLNKLLQKQRLRAEIIEKENKSLIEKPFENEKILGKMKNLLLCSSPKINTYKKNYSENRTEDHCLKRKRKPIVTITPKGIYQYFYKS